MNRKKFIGLAGRAAILGGMAVLTLSFLQKDRIAAPGKCSDSSFCRGCSKYNKCSEPAALKAHGDEK